MTETVRSWVSKMRKNWVHSLKKTWYFEKNQIQGIEIEVKLKVLDNDCHMTFVSIVLGAKITLLQLPFFLDTSSTEYGICWKGTLKGNLVKKSFNPVLKNWRRKSKN